MADNNAAERNTYREGTPNDRLVQLHARFRNSTMEEIEEISKEMNWTKASTVRRLVEIGLENCDNRTGVIQD